MERLKEFNIAASLAVEQYLDYRGAPPAGWPEEMIAQGVGEYDDEGRLRLTALSHQYRQQLMHRG